MPEMYLFASQLNSKFKNVCHGDLKPLWPLYLQQFELYGHGRMFPVQLAADVFADIKRDTVMGIVVPN